MKPHIPEEALAAGCARLDSIADDIRNNKFSFEEAGSTLVFTVDMPTPGARYRDAHSGMSGPNAAMRRYLQAVTHPQWAWDVGLNGRPHDLGNISAYLGKPTGLEDYIGWLGNNFDPSISWKDLEWIRDYSGGGFYLFSQILKCSSQIVNFFTHQVSYSIFKSSLERFP